jgi:hypothetical protein
MTEAVGRRRDIFRSSGRGTVALRPLLIAVRDEASTSDLSGTSGRAARSFAAAPTELIERTSVTGAQASVSRETF